MSSIGLQEREFAAEAITCSLRKQDARSVGGSRFELLLTVVEVSGDMIAVACAVIVAYALYQMLDVGRHVRYAWEYVVLAALGFGLVSVVLLDREGAYRKGGSLLRIRETERVLRVSVTTLALALAVSFFAGRFVSRGAVVLGVILVPLLLISEKQVVCAAVQSLHRRGYGIKKVLIYGAGFTGRRVLSALMRSPKVGLSPIAVLDDDGSIAGSVVYESSYRRANPVPVLAGPLTEEVLRRTGAEMLAVAIPSLGRERFTRALAACTAAGVQFAFVPGQAVGSEFLTDHTEIDGLLLSSFVQPTSKRLYDISKRLFDFLGAGLLLVAISPLLVALGILVRIDSCGPALYRQKRVGRHGTLFEMYKFRTMYVQLSGDADSPQTPEDPRITRAGRLLRRTSLDELPQLLNVLKGDMSLVGPRPEMPFIVKEYGSREWQRLHVTPGITGLWQLSADRAFRIHENIQYDLYYIKNRSFFMDLAILLHTAIFAMRGV